MENLETMIQLLYKRVSVKKVLDGKILCYAFERKEFLRMARAYIPYYSENEVVNLLNYFLELFGSAARREGRRISDEINVFEPLFYFAEKFLAVRNNEVVCRYRFLLDWRRRTTALSEEMFVAAYYAKKLTIAKLRESDFSWKRVIGHDNAALNAIIKRKISENHSHLNGAAPIFQISWLSLMNNVSMSKFADCLREYDEDRLYQNIAYTGEYKEDSLYYKYMQAVLIRLLLFSVFSGKRLKIGNYDMDFLSIRDELSIPFVWMGTSAIEPYVDKPFREKLGESLNQKQRAAYSFKELAVEIIRCYLELRGEGEESLRTIWMWNAELLQILRGPVGECLLDSCQVREIIRRSEGRLISELFIELLSVNERISLERIEMLFCDKKRFMTLWKRKTLNNVKRLLQDPWGMEWEKDNIQSIIDSFRYRDEKNDGKKLDYALGELRNMGMAQEKPSFIYAGERWLMCMAFRQICENRKESVEYFNLFYAYLLIKENIRSELVKSNENVGFENFQRYQRRKGKLLADKIYKNRFTKLAVADGMNSGNILNMEVRIAPESDVEHNYDAIRRLDELLVEDQKQKKHLFYIVHFIKASDEEKFNLGYTYCRHHKLRKQIERQANALAELRERFPDAGKRVLGIDAASNEIGCRPEVFAPVFRYLKSHRCSYDDVGGMAEEPQLNATYHVGEDFLDIADGLRAIEEAILFLNLDSGERLGHALALGIDAEEWYQKKRYRVALPMQDYLDNLVWIYHKLFQYDMKGFGNLKEWIQGKYSELFGKIYYMNFSQGDIKGISKANSKVSYQKMDLGIFHYYRAWELRGDDPELYELGYFNEKNLLEEFRVNFQHPEDYDIRQVPEIALIYYMYHYNEGVREAGGRTIEVNVSREYVRAVAAIQKALQRDIAERGLSIEANPSSNFLIGTFRQYEKHPILNFYNQGLVHDPKQRKECPQLSVSINTDDQGVFSTSLENEYALLAHALESVCDEDGNALYCKADIYEWLDRIRIMGNEQNFAYALKDN